MTIERRKMGVHLIHSTPNAEQILSFAKDTRLLGDTGALDPKESMLDADRAKVMKNVEYSMNTIRGPLEFIHYIFLILNASRAMTHQLVRHRVVSFAQQSLRVSDDFGYYQPDSIQPGTEKYGLYKLHMQDTEYTYRKLISLGMDIQDARGVLPIHATSAILLKVNLRSLLEMFETRLCLRVQGEHRDAMLKMATLSENNHSWLKGHIGPICATKGICAFPRYDCPISKAVPELKGLSDEKLKSIKEMLGRFGSKGLAPKTQNMEK